MSSTLPPSVLRRAIVKAVGRQHGENLFDDDELVRVAQAIQEQGYLIVVQSDVHALRAAADKVLRWAPSTPWPHRFNGDVGQPCREPGCGQMASNGAAH